MSLETVHCPICKRPAAWKDNPDRPFCSERCRLIDLGAWAAEAYTVPGEKLPNDQGTDPEQI